MLGFAAGGLLTERGVFDFLISGLTPPIFSLSDATSLPALLGITPAWVILGVVGFVGFLLWALSKPPRTAGSWAWYETGLVLAVVSNTGVGGRSPDRLALGIVNDRTEPQPSGGCFGSNDQPFELGSLHAARCTSRKFSERALKRHGFVAVAAVTRVSSEVPWGVPYGIWRDPGRRL